MSQQYSRGDSYRGPRRGGGRGGGGRGEYRGGGRGGGGRGEYRGGGRGGGRGSGGPPGPSAEETIFANVPAPSSEVTNFEDKFIQANKGARARPGELAIRPGYGTAGKPIVLRANFFQMFFKPDTVFHTYAVACKPEGGTKKLRMEVFKKLIKVPEIASALPATEGAQELVTLKKLDLQRLGPVEITLGGDDNARKFTLTLKEGITINPQAFINALGNQKARAQVEDEATAIRMINMLMGAVPFGDPRVVVKGAARNKIARIDNQRQAYDLTGGIECLRAFFSSVRFGGARILLNLNVNHGAFYQPGPLVNLVTGFMRVYGENRSLFNRYVRYLPVNVIHLPPRKEDGVKKPRQKTIWGLASPQDGHGEPNPPRVPRLGSCANNVQFFMEVKDKSGKPTGKGTYISVADYFKRTYKKELEWAHYPVMNVGTSKKPVYLPIDVCVIPPGQSFAGELGTAQRQHMITFSCRKPPQNYESIMREGLDITGIAQDKTNTWGLRADKKMISVPGRILPPPVLKYGNGKENPRDGAWNLRGKTFCQGATVNAWSGLLIQKVGDKPVDVTRTLQAFRAMSKDMGVNWPAPILPYLKFTYDDRRPQDWVKDLTDLFEKYRSKVQLLVVMLPNGADRIFEYVKFLGDIRYGLLTHCCLTMKFLKEEPQYYANNAMKVNLKFGGVCQSLDQPHRLIAGGKTMVVGLDVTHPSPTDYDGFPSLAGIVASIDGRLGQWPGEIRIQKRKQEKIEYLKDMMLGRLRRWQQSNQGQLPNNILIFRDGVSDGQFKMVLNEELKLVKDAVQAIYKNMTPNISILVVGKRHNVRFYPTSSNDWNFKTQNCKPGTIVDRGITRPIYWDWYLQAQAPLQGSARPAHYIVIHDEIYSAPNADPNPADSLQNLTHGICYIMGRCTRSISYCTPAFLADRFCDRARKYVRAYFFEHECRGQAPPNFVPDNVVALGGNARERMVYI